METNQFSAVVKSICWERIWCILKLEIHNDNSITDWDDIAVCLVNEKGIAVSEFQIAEYYENTCSIKINVSNPGGGSCLPDGAYSIGIVFKGIPVVYAVTDPSIAGSLEAQGRSFLYDHRSNSYSVNFYLKGESDALLLELYILSTGDRNNELHLDKKMLARAAYVLFRSLRKPRGGKRVLFLTEQSHRLESNLKAVYDRFLERDESRLYNIQVSHRSSGRKSKGLLSWFHVIWKVAGSSLIIVDDHVPLFDTIHLKDTKVIQLWHAGAGFKSSGYSRWGHEGCPGKWSCHRQYTYGIAGSAKIAPFFSEVWGIDDERVISTGMPRMDRYLDPTQRDRITAELKNRFQSANGRKILLFAPTYRGTNKKTAYYPYDRLDLQYMSDHLSKEYYILFKMHPWVAEPIHIPEHLKEHMTDVTAYPDINELFYITDLLITDYSSNIYEYSLMGRPMMFYAFDELSYSNSRGFHRDYRASAPGKVCVDFKELTDSVKAGDFEEEKVEAYVAHHFDYTDTKSSDRVIDWLILGQLPDHLIQEVIGRDKRIQELRTIDFSINI